MRGSGRFGASALRLTPRLRFQSPSLRGSGRFAQRLVAETGGLRVFQSPSLRGSGRFDVAKNVDEPTIVFQSPSLRGSGRFVDGRVRV